jgi:hypothetical protein
MNLIPANSIETTMPATPMYVWTYVITYDEGGAPNFEPPATTLTVCKPRIRRAARPGEGRIASDPALLNLPRL